MVQPTTEAFATADLSVRATDLLSWFDDLPFEPLVIPLAMVVGVTFVDHSPQM
jgi:hypothetical protein